MDVKSPYGHGTGNGRDVDCNSNLDSWWIVEYIILNFGNISEIFGFHHYPLTQCCNWKKGSASAGDSRILG